MFLDVNPNKINQNTKNNTFRLKWINTNFTGKKLSINFMIFNILFNNDNYLVCYTNTKDIKL